MFLLAFLEMLPRLAESQVVNSKQNPLQIALTHCYPVNLTTLFVVGNNPQAIAFDGANLWVANANDNAVAKLRASDGANLGRSAVGSFPTAVAFDGANVWVANRNDGTVSELRASDGAKLGTFPGQFTFVSSSIAFDGTNIWIAGTDNIGDLEVTKLRASDGRLLGVLTLNNNCFQLSCIGGGVAYDGANL